ncbi:hypothetical protein EB796_015693 [Bugula neritina]|uniref:Uncharacterized protein n=1 Tax=Bugula neritina TaxID=10212 RepID=A0A7J7JKW9_BUGNE|nr:hypothetical protein EB796_015693 [Bugula neritina]
MRSPFIYSISICLSYEVILSNSEDSSSTSCCILQERQTAFCRKHLIGTICNRTLRYFAEQEIEICRVCKEIQMHCWNCCERKH